MTLWSSGSVRVAVNYSAFASQDISPLYVLPLLLFVLRYAQSSYIDPL